MYFVVQRPGAQPVFHWTGSNFSEFQTEWESQGTGFTVADNGDGTITVQPANIVITAEQWVFPTSAIGFTTEQILDGYQFRNDDAKVSYVLRDE